MNIIISPAKKMNICNEDIQPFSLPCFINKTQTLYNKLKNFSYGDLQKLLCCNDSITSLNFQRYKNMDLHSNLTPAILSYEGIQYKYMSPNTFTYEDFDYVQKHLKILSGFYGVLKPMDGITPYRLEMQSKLKLEGFKDLYEFWGDSIYKELSYDNKVILNLASKEYSKIIEKYLTPNDKFITCIFGNLKDSKIKIKATEAKMARGLMVRYIAKNKIEDIDEIIRFSDLGFSFSKEHSSESKFVFLK